MVKSLLSIFIQDNCFWKSDGIGKGASENIIWPEQAKLIEKHYGVRSKKLMVQCTWLIIIPCSFLFTPY